PYDIWAYFYVPYDMLHKLRVGQSVTGLLPEAPDQTFPGRIIKISEEAEFTPKNVQTREERTRLVYGIKVKFDNPNLTLKSGMTIESNLIDE
ncbi:MAG: HlyD family efflux transporter periplasmic adaptor subunit, partial [Alphaproteobacteria bacterium]|nr:HlyD family efflux transporter periplasmic adaptor subunit [Alphaproteobacteria bacterium]